MHFAPHEYYHVYNRGNNKQPIFFNQVNYLFFLKKIRDQLLPCADIIAYCLMPNPRLNGRAGFSLYVAGK